MTAEELAALHRRAFAGQSRAWNAEEFEKLLQSDLVFLLGDELAYALVRVVADEAELLTLVCAPEYRRNGLARARLKDLEHEALRRGAERIFLEVASDNHAALRLYEETQFVEIGRRRAYYDTSVGRVDAVIMEKRL